MASEQIFEDKLAVLQEEYSPYLESSVVAAILLDHDRLEDAKQVLDLLKEATPLDDALAFNSNGDNGSSSDWGNNYNFDGDGETPATSVSVRSNEDELPAGAMDADVKLAQLSIMFPNFSPFTLRHTLDKCQGDVDRAVDELLSRCFLDEEGEGGKGIDGLSEDMMLSLPVSGKRKGKARRRKARKGFVGVDFDMPLSPTSPSEWSDSGGNDRPVRSRWEDMNEEVSFLSKALNLPKATVTSAYHEHGSLSAAVLPLVKAHGKCDQMPEDADHLESVHALASRFPTLPTDLLNGVLKLCRGDDVPVATELARHMMRSVNQSLLPSPMPLSPTAIHGDEKAKRPAAWRAVDHRKERTVTPLSPKSPTSHATAREVATHHLLARNEAFDKAHAAYRRSKSDKLMGAVATYYADVGRVHDGKKKALDLAAAEAFVDENINTVRGQVLDLHGVTVQHAITITRERVTEWWVGWGRIYGEDMMMKGPERGGVDVRPFRIITGKGTHSKNGDTRLGPAVAKALMKENWKIEVWDGYITVFGVAKRR